MTSVAIYCRTATEDPMEPSHLDEQEAACRQYCEEHGLTISAVYREVAAGMQYRERPELTKLRQSYLTGDIKGVVVSTLDRLSRSMEHQIALMEEMEQYSIILHTAKEDLNGRMATRDVWRTLRSFSGTHHKKPHNGQAFE